MDWILQRAKAFAAALAVGVMGAAIHVWNAQVPDMPIPASWEQSALAAAASWIAVHWTVNRAA